MDDVLSKRAELLWDRVYAQELHIVNELASSLIGIGALFFAYAELRGSPIQQFIALIGLGGSAILWLHCYLANKERDAAFALLRDAGTVYDQVAKGIGAWREGHTSRFLVPLTAAATWFLGWVAVIWLWIVLSSRFPSFTFFTQPAWVYELVVLFLAVGTYLELVHVNTVRKKARKSVRTLPMGDPASPTEK